MDQSMIFLVLCELFLPLLSFMALISFGKKLGNHAHWISIVLIGIMLGISMIFFRGH